MKHGGPRKFTQTSDYLLVCYLSMVAVVKAAHNTQMLFPGSLELISFALPRFLDFLLLTHIVSENMNSVAAAGSFAPGPSGVLSPIEQRKQ